jgi:hypothetical protein
VSVTVAGEALGFSAAKPPTLGFGADITVSSVEVVDPDSAVATVQIAETAAIGPRNVTIQAGAVTLTATKAFDVEPPLDVSVAQDMTGKPLGQAGQGDTVALTIHNLDTADALDSNVLYETTGSSILSQLDETATDLTAVVLFDPLAPTGPLQLELANPTIEGAAGLSFVSAPGVLTVAARTPTKVAFGATKNDAIAAPFGTNVYELSSTGAAIVSLAVTSDPSLPIVPRLRVYGSDGLSDQLLDDVGGEGLLGATPAQDMFPLTSDTTMYLVVLDGNFGGGSGYSYTFSPTSLPVSNVITAPTTAHGTPATAPNETTKCVPGPCIIEGSLTTAGQTDAYSLTLTATATVTISYDRDPKTGIVAVIAPATSDNSGFDFTNMEVSSSQAAATQPANVASSQSMPGTAGVWYVVVFDAGSQVGGTVSTGKYTLSIQTM